VSAARTLHVDRHARTTNAAASLEEVVTRLLAEEFDAIVLHRYGTTWDEYGVTAYLAGTWPQYLHQIALKSVTTDGRSATWNAALGAFQREPGVPRTHAFRRVGGEEGRVEVRV
jgi:L-lactate utilization protein LutC